LGLTRRGPACRAEFGLGAQVFSADTTLPKDEDLVPAMGAESGSGLDRQTAFVTEIFIGILYLDSFRSCLKARKKAWNH
jgi:hypothetical protein